MTSKLPFHVENLSQYAQMPKKQVLWTDSDIFLPIVLIDTSLEFTKNVTCDNTFILFSDTMGVMLSVASVLQLNT